MAHEIESMMFAKSEGLPWHGLGTEMQDADLFNWPLACQKAGLDWEVELVPLVTHDTGATVEHKAVRRKSDGRTLGVVGPRYTPLQNRDAFQWFAAWLEAKEASLSTAGSLRQGSRIWVLAKINRDPLVIAAGDEISKYLLLSSGHDGSLAVRCGFCPIRVVCANTLAMAHNSDASQLIRIKHSKSVLENLAAVRETISIANQRFEATGEQYRRLVRKSVNQADVRKYVYQVLDIEDESKASTRLLNIANSMIELAERGRGNDLAPVRGTLWASFNGVTEHLAYERGNNKESRLDSLWFGSSAAMNKKALDVALSLAV